MTNINDTLRERGALHGDFATNAHIAQGVKTFCANQPGYDNLTEVQREAIDLIATKLARILSGANNAIDNWHDIAGYATLAEMEVSGNRVADMFAAGLERLHEVQQPPALRPQLDADDAIQAAFPN